jgi:hypothetical protein
MITARMRELFDAFDSGGDGKIDDVEFWEVLPAVTPCQQSCDVLVVLLARP